MKGVEPVDRPADERGRRRGPAIDASRVAVVSGPEPRTRDRPPPADGDQDRVDERRDGAAGRTCLVRVVLRPYTNFDVVGVGSCGAVKNVIALAVVDLAGPGSAAATRWRPSSRAGSSRSRAWPALGADADTFPGPRAGATHGDVRVADSRNHARRAHRPRHDARRGDRRDWRGPSGGREVVPVGPGAMTSLGVEMPTRTRSCACSTRGCPSTSLAPLLLARPHKAEGAWTDSRARSVSLPLDGSRRLRLPTSVPRGLSGTRGHRRGAVPSAGRRRVQRLREVPPQVLDVLDAHGQPGPRHG